MTASVFWTARSVSEWRAEDVGRSNNRENFDVALARAVATMDWLAEWCLPLVKKGGKVLAMKGPKVAEELPAAAKALSEEDIAALLNGEGLGMAKAAELNGYPGPKHVPTLATELKLTDAQRQQVQAIFEQMNAAARPLGMELIGRELLLDRLFAEGEVTPDRLAIETAAIGTLEGSLRSAHLGAHLQTRALLNVDQISLYNRLRGYDSLTAPHDHQHH